MSKYQRLESHANAMPTSGATTMTTTTDESFSLFFDNYHNHNNNTNTHNEHDNDSSNNNKNISFSSTASAELNHSYSSKNNNININNSHSNAVMDADENNTMEVPLLHSNNNNNNDYEPHPPPTPCRCAQPGFGANLINKSTQEAKFKILLAISLCCVFMIVEFLGGYFAGSLAIMTDAAHLASDCISFVIGLVAIWLGSRPPDARMSFGYKRMEVIGAIVSILGIWLLTATLVLMAVQRLYSNDFDLDAHTMMTISGIGILINIAMVFILHGPSLQSGGHGHSHSHAAHHAHSHSQSHSHLHAPQTQTDILLMADGASSGNGLKHTPNGTAEHHEKNLNLRAAMIHVIGDLVQSVGVFLASVVINFYPSAKFADPLCTLLFSVIVIMTTVRLFKESVGVLMDAVPQGFPFDELEIELSHIDGVKSVHHLNVWSHTANHNVLMGHLLIDLLTDSNTVLDKATQLACSAKYKIKHCTIQIERLTS